MNKLVIDSVSHTATNASGVIATFTTWQGNKQFSSPKGDFIWVRRWTRVGPDGGNEDTVKGTVDFAKLTSFLADKDVCREFEFHELVAAGVATPA